MPRGSTADTTNTFGLVEELVGEDKNERLDEFVGDTEDLLDEELHDELPSEPRPSRRLRRRELLPCHCWLKERLLLLPVKLEPATELFLRCTLLAESVGMGGR